jgi:hypothetical protein
MKNALEIASRNSEGCVSVLSQDGTYVTAKVPQDRSMLGIMGVNGIIPGGDYRDDGWVYFNGLPVRKWHSKIDSVRIWEPKMKNLPDLYRLWKRVKTSDHNQWERISDVLSKLWGNHKAGDIVKAHAMPVHNFEWTKTSQPWWEYHIRNIYGEGLSFGFDWLDKKPKRLSHPDLGQKLYELEWRWWGSGCVRVRKVQTIFYAAMKNSLPKATEDKVIALQFGDDTFWFYSVNKGPKVVWWEQWNDRYAFEMKRIV